jgi:phosphatidylglycerophosphatase A
MKAEIERRKPEGILDYLSLGITTVGVGYIPLAPGTWGSAVGVLIYHFATFAYGSIAYIIGLSGGGFPQYEFVVPAIVSIMLVCLCLLGIWASGRSIPLLGNTDPSQAVIDEVMGQLVVYLFVPFGISWPFILAGFLLFRLFDIWKPYPIRALEILPGGLGICADDLVAGVYAGVCLSVIVAVSISI